MAEAATLPADIEAASSRKAPQEDAEATSPKEPPADAAGDPTKELPLPCVYPRRDSKVRIALVEPVVISSEGGDEWCRPPNDIDDILPSSSSSSLSSEGGPEGGYELDPGLAASSDEEAARAELERVTSRNTARNSFSVTEPAPCATFDDGEMSDENERPLPEVHYCQYDKKEPPPPPLKNGAPVPYRVVDVPPPLTTKSKGSGNRHPPPPRPSKPPDASRRSLLQTAPPAESSPSGPVVLPPPPSSPPPPLPKSLKTSTSSASGIVVPPPPNTPPPPTPSSRTKAPPAGPKDDTVVDLPKIVYEEKESVKNAHLVPIVYSNQSQQSPASQHQQQPPVTSHHQQPQQQPQSLQHQQQQPQSHHQQVQQSQSHQQQQLDAKRGGSSFMNKVGKLQKGMKHLKKRLTSPEAPEPPPSAATKPAGPQWHTAKPGRPGELPPPPPPNEAPHGEPLAVSEWPDEVDDTRVSGHRHIQTQKNVRPPKPPPPTRPADIGASRPKPKPRLAGGLKEKIVDLEDLTCLDSLFPFLSNFLGIGEDAPLSGPEIPPAVVDLCAQNFLLSWSGKWQRRSEKDLARGKVDGPFQLGECPLFGRRYPVFEGRTASEKLVALPPDQLSPPAFSFCPPRCGLTWRCVRSDGPVLVSVACCCPLDRLLALLDAADEPVAPLKHCLALAALVLALAAGLPPSAAPAQVMVLLSRHDLRFLLAEPAPPPAPISSSSSEGAATDRPPSSPLERLAPHMAGPGEEGGDLSVALSAFRGAVLSGQRESVAWRRAAAPLLLPHLYEPFKDSDLFAPFLTGLLLSGEAGPPFP